MELNLADIKFKPAQKDRKKNGILKPYAAEDAFMMSHV